MIPYIIKRILTIIPIVFVISLITFSIIQLPPGDYATVYISQLREEGQRLSTAEISKIREDLGLDQPTIVQYGKWISGIVLRGDFGYSFGWNMKVTALIGDRIFLTVVVAMTTLIFSYMVAVPIGIYSATHQYTPGDYAATFFGFIGLATPNFLLGLIIMYLLYRYFGLSVGGLFSPEFVGAPFSLAKLIDFIKHLFVPVIVIGTASVAGLLRVVRANLLDELEKQYVITARSKGVGEKKLLYKYPIRAAMNPVVSSIGWVLPALFSGSTVTAIVLNLPTVGTLLMGALMAQDMYLAGSLLFIMACLTVVGTLVSDILLAWLDPRIRLEGKGSR
jgi:peptide/nickel transport system permease protein